MRRDAQDDSSPLPSQAEAVGSELLHNQRKHIIRGSLNEELTELPNTQDSPLSAIE